MIARVYQTINNIAAELAHDGVAKTRLNARGNYLYRSVDDVLARLAPLLAAHRLCILPRVLERMAAERHDETGGLLVSVTLRAAFDLVSAEDGSCHTIEAYGEALDAGDKATAKAMQSAYKYAVLQAFCVPAAQVEDADASSHRLTPTTLPAAPAKGWPRWCDGLAVQVEACASPGAIRQLQDDNRASLAALSRERPELYRGLGEAIVMRKAALGGIAAARTAPATSADRAQSPQDADAIVARAEADAGTTATPKRPRNPRPKGPPPHAPTTRP